MDDSKSLCKKWLEITKHPFINGWPWGSRQLNPPTWTNIFTWPSFSNWVSRISRFKSNFSWTPPRNENETNETQTAGWNRSKTTRFFEDFTTGEMPVVKMVHPQTNECPLKKGTISIGNYIWTNHGFSGDMLDFREVGRNDPMSGIFTCYLAI